MDCKGSWVIGGRNNDGGGENCVGVISENNENTVEVVWNNGNTEICDNSAIHVYDLGPPGLYSVVLFNG